MAVGVVARDATQPLSSHCLNAEVVECDVFAPTNGYVVAVLNAIVVGDVVADFVGDGDEVDW